jgi:hypothetical protein
MPGTTTELALSTAVDADDNADYLTISLANSLRTVDALFNNVTGHNHGAAHQGGPIAAAGIPAGSITSAMIADGTIATVDLAAGAATNLMAFASINSSFSTTTPNAWVETNVVTSTFTATGVATRIDYSTQLQHSVQNAIVYIGYMVDHVIVGGLAYFSMPVASFPAHFSGFVYVQPLAAGAHTVSLAVQTTTAGTLSLRAEGPSNLSVQEFRR